MDLKYEGDEGGAGMAWVGNDAPASGNVLFQGVRDYAAPRWPDPAHPQQLHLDVHGCRRRGGRGAGVEDRRHAGCRVRATTGGSTRTRPVTRSAWSGEFWGRRAKLAAPRKTVADQAFASLFPAHLGTD